MATQVTLFNGFQRKHGFSGFRKGKLIQSEGDCDKLLFKHVDKLKFYSKRIVRL